MAVCTVKEGDTEIYAAWKGYSAASQWLQSFCKGRGALHVFQLPIFPQPYGGIGLGYSML
ncbi:hypothetical protein B1F79_05120 [Coxiella-like endosymbiont of Rhipicephalus sanguineus]|uniref:hypothetical protein n=1 Tax=Coxiella-like endosymbiont of Rhipicephalus sanguineus TaxID=1955402 RepID=UPI00203A6657|nr:hypothetical protein [Coxiella-like endosymbiont of Rhipicephalus sanguineus]MBT8506786.1 hypothetical protein [Coxiella-like endosymbiont of Rhipicephalus sanguineus]